MKKFKTNEGLDFFVPLKKVLFMARLTMFLLLLGLLQVSAESYSQTARLSLKMKNVPIASVFQEIEEISQFRLFYDNDLVDLSQQVSVEAEGETIQEVLDKVFVNTGLSYEIMDRFILVKANGDKGYFREMQEFAQQQKSVSGVVTDSDKQPLPGVTILVKGTMRGTVTNDNGEYSISNLSEDATLVFSFVGMRSQEVEVGDQTSIDIVMEVEAIGIEEVVAVGYGVSITKEKLTGSIASVQGDELMDRPTTSPMTLLSGLASGVNITTRTSMPGTTPDVKIRETSSWRGGADVLYVIDGVVRDVEAFQALNPNDIGSLSVLKDAASAAIYGMKAGNGVILVSTKSGISGEVKITYGYSYSSSTPIILLDKLNAYEYALQQNKWNTMVGRDPGDSRFFLPYELEYFEKNSFNSYDEFWSNPVLQNHNLAASGGSEKMNYFVSGSFNTSDQSSFGIGQDKYTLRAKIRGKISKRLSFDLNLSASWEDNERPAYATNWRGHNIVNNLNDAMDGFFGRLYLQPAISPYYKEIDGKKYALDHNSAKLLLGEGGYETFNKTFINPVMSVKYTIPGIEGLSASVQFAYNNRFSKEKHWFTSPYKYNFITDRHIVTDEFDYAHPEGWRFQRLTHHQTTKYLMQEHSFGSGYQGNYQFNYAHTFGLHHVSGIAGYEFRGSTGNFIRAERYGYDLETYQEINGGSNNRDQQRTAGDITAQDGMASWIGRVDYNFNDKYFIGATVRRDGSYKFSPEKRWGTFPAVSAAWIASKESFFEPLYSVFSLFKIRGSMGITGTDNTNPWQWIDTFKGGSQQSAGTETYSTLSTSVVPNPNITWEKNANYNLAGDFGLLNNSIFFTLEGWYKRTTDILSNRIASIPEIVGANMPAVNYGIASARGLEFSADHQKRIGEFTYSVGGHVAYSMNKIVEQDVNPATREYDNPVGKPMNRLRVWEILVNETGNGVVRTQAEASRIMAENGIGATRYTTTGQQIMPGMVYALDFRGPNNTIYADSPDGNVNQNGIDDKVFVDGKYTSPRMNFGLNAKLKWRDIELNMIAAGVGAYWRPWNRGITSVFQLFSNFWPNEWDFDNINGMPSPIYAVKMGGYVGGGTDKPSTLNTFNMSFMRMKNISLGYNIHDSFINSKTGIQALKVYMNMENPFMIFKASPDYMDPESNEGVGYPILRNYSLGVNITI